MEEAKASWNTIYQSKEGFDCQFTLRDDDEAGLVERAKKVMTSIVKSGGVPVKRHSPANDNHHTNGEAPKPEANNNGPSKPEKTYVDEQGTRRCNLKLKNGQVCGQPVTDRQGRYGPFWSCPNYKEHAA